MGHASNKGSGEPSYTRGRQAGRGRFPGLKSLCSLDLEERILGKVIENPRPESQPENFLLCHQYSNMTELSGTVQILLQLGQEIKDLVRDDFQMCVLP